MPDDDAFTVDVVGRRRQWATAVVLALVLTGCASGPEGSADGGGTPLAPLTHEEELERLAVDFGLDPRSLPQVDVVGRCVKSGETVSDSPDAARADASAGGAKPGATHTTGQAHPPHPEPGPGLTPRVPMPECSRF